MTDVDDTTNPPPKRCSKCLKYFPATNEYFSYDVNRKDGLYVYCKHCRSAYAKGQGKAKIQEYGKDYRQRNSEKIKMYKQQYRRNNAEMLSKNHKEYRAKNIDRLRESNRLYNEANRDKHKIYQKENKQKIRERVKKYRQNNTDKVRLQDKRYREKSKEKRRIHEQRRRTRKMSLPFTFTNEDWNRCLNYFDYCCAYCGRQRGLWHILAQDHWIPLANGGEYTPTNILPACHGMDGCNNSKHNRDGKQWLVDKFGERKAVQIYIRINNYFEWVKQDGDH